MSGATATPLREFPPPPRTPSRTMSVRRHRDEAFHLLRPFWNPLLHASRADSMFLSWEWQESWWRHFGAGRGRELEVVTVHGPDERIVGIAPMYRERASWNGIPLRTLRLVGDGSGDGDDLDVFALPGHEASVCAALLRWLQESPDWDVLDLCPVPAESQSLRALRSLAASSGWYARERELACTYTRLPATWEDFLSTLKSRLRSRCRSLLRRHVDEGGNGRLERIRCARDIDRGLRVLFDLHDRRWQASGEPGAFAEGSRRGFFRDLAMSAHGRGALRLWLLHVEEQPVAAQIGFVHGSTFLAIQEGFDPDAGNVSPGVALRAAVLRACIEEGLSAYDNLLGTPPQKLRWGAEPRAVNGLTLARPASAGASALRLIDAGRHARDVVRGLLERGS